MGRDLRENKGFIVNIINIVWNKENMLKKNIEYYVLYNVGFFIV